jgi:ASC-1-like (ASCH) protein
MAMPLFMVKKQHFQSYLSGRRDVELRAVRSQWKNCQPGDTAVLQCGRTMLRKQVKAVYKGSLAKIFLTVDYHRIFPEVRDVMDAIHAVKELYPYAELFMAFELEDPAS